MTATATVPSNYYWVEADTGKVLGRSNSFDYAIRMAERYSYDTARFAACNMVVATDPEKVAETIVASYPANPGVRWPGAS